MVAGLVVLALLGMGLWWWAQAGSEGWLVDIDQAPPLEAHFQVDLNKASWPEMAQLPGIGPTLAQRIVEYRAVHGPFQTHEELTKVRGIGQKTLERIRPYLLPLPSDCPRPNLASPPAP